MRGEEYLERMPSFCHDAASGDAHVIGFCLQLVNGCWDERERLDEIVRGVLEHWTLERIAAIDRCVLRLGAYELLHVPEVPPKVAINEAIDLAKKFSTQHSGVFVNGILDKILAQHPRPDAAPPADPTDAEAGEPQ